MSFLASLRPPQSRQSATKQLSWLLGPGIEPGEISLRLYLSDVREAPQQGAHEPYCVQRLHLVHPPAFLHSDDVQILKSLIDVAPLCLAPQPISLDIHFPWPLLADILRTGRCFVAMQDGIWRRAAETNEARPLAVAWRMDHNGTQNLHWHWANSTSKQGLKVFLLGEQLVALDWRPAQAEWCFQPGSTGFAPALLRPVFEQKQHSVSAADAQSVHAAYSPLWSPHALPLPACPTPDIHRATVQPVLICRCASNAQGELIDQLQLAFALQSERYCSLPQVLQHADKPVYWNGDQLISLDYDEAESSRFTQLAKDLLQDYFVVAPDASATTTVFHARDARTWRTFFLDQNKPLELNGFVVLVEPGFRQHYLAIEKWQVEVDDAPCDSLHVNLSLQAGGRSYDFHQLLIELKEFNKTVRDHMHVQLPGGEWLAIPSRQVSLILEEIGDLLQGQGGSISLPKSQRHRLAEIQAALPGDSQWTGALHHVDQSLDLRKPPFLLQQSANLVQATLRPYQWLGVCWIAHLKNCGANGLLADDMGLGKTLQTLALLSLQQQQGQLTHPALVVVPRSLLYNWAAEIKRFTPHLSHLVIHGQNRQQLWPALAQTHILLTTYHSLVSDIEQWQKQPLSWCILDEAQTIKNVHTQVNQAVNQIVCEHKLCLSGTPIENHVGELWALFNFLMPGCLGNRKEFQAHFQKPIEKEGNARRLDQLRTRVAPFMLRRSKDQIAQDLPPKTEISRLIPLHEQQQDLYHEIKSGAWQQLQEQLQSTDNPGTKQVFILSALLKLRQACCDPALLDEPDVPSAKREYCLSMIEELVEEKSAVLVFSQFTRMLDILAAALTEKNIPWLMLTGKTNNRQALVDAFQAGEAPVFLISLKAGGTGLNLTRADTVIHYDPWWNKAAEMQASDRAHRIGQQRPVFVYKLIAQNTIEEKIAQLQERKAIVSQHINQQAQLAGEEFSLKFEELLELLQMEMQKEETLHD